MEEHIITEKPRQNWLIALISATVFMFSVDYSMLNISLPTIAKYFGATIAHVSQLPLAYLLVVTSTVLLFGKLGDIIGFKKIFIAGLAVFITGTFLCGIAPSINILLGMRVYQCLGEAMFSPMGIAIITVFLPSAVKGRALGIMATAQGLGFCVGSALGGYINDHFGWHGIFFVNIPIGIAVMIAAIKVVPPKQPLSKDKRVDIPGAVLIFACLSTLICALNSISAMGIRSPFILSCFAISAVAFALFMIQEKRSPNPILDLPLFKNLNFTFATISALSVVFVYMGLLFLFPFYLNIVRGIDTMRSGLVLMVPAFMVMVSAPIAGFVSDRIGCRPVCTAGIIMTTLSFFAFSFFTTATPMHHIIITLALAGVAIGCFLPANNKLVMTLAPSDKQGMASAIYKILNSIGGVFGIALLPLILMRKVFALAEAGAIEKAAIKLHPEILMQGFDAAFTFGMYVCIAGLIFTILAKDEKA